MSLLRKIRDTGRVAEPAPPKPEGGQLPAARELGGSVQVRCVDAGSFATGIDGQPCGPLYQQSFVDHGTNGPRNAERAGPARHGE
ncbi:hypothetical protein [Streptomyces sp. BK340]|uniref:hypothetical protein n=1 Tax=Streptomyces sp. BK340 TaxID=2572903 RepID=UPI0011AD9547|nr:hypothetical protein [Streptomyces sp. BK340]TVZ92467.1 hypothetical protein FB157_108192 [Streptomyces sp. BK340]